MPADDDDDDVRVRRPVSHSFDLGNLVRIPSSTRPKSHYDTLYVQLPDRSPLRSAMKSPTSSRAGEAVENVNYDMHEPMRRNNRYRKASTSAGGPKANTGGFLRSGSMRALRRWMHKSPQQPTTNGSVFHDTEPSTSGVVVEQRTVPRPQSLESVTASPRVVKPSTSTNEVVNGGTASTSSPTPLGLPLQLGLVNHGNTCFMNAIVQCLAHIQPLAEYLLSERYVSDSGGQPCPMTESLHRLMHSLYANTYSGGASGTLSKVAAQFDAIYGSGQQQDAHEFLVFLLQRVHDEVNRRGNKARTSLVGREEGQDAWLTNHRRTHRSLISSVFECRLRSSITCHKCRHARVQFEPATHVSLTAPQMTKRPLFLTVVHRRRSVNRLVTYGLNADTTATLRDVRQCLLAEAQLSDDAVSLPTTPLSTVCQCVIIELSASSLGAHHLDHSLVTSIAKRELYCVQLPSTRVASDVALVLSIVLVSGYDRRRVTYPYSTACARQSSFEQLLDAVMRALSPAFIHPIQFTVAREHFAVGHLRLAIVSDHGEEGYIDGTLPMPLYGEGVQQALSRTPFLRVNVEWLEQVARPYVGVHCDERVTEHESAREQRVQMSVPRVNATLYDRLDELTAAELLTDGYKCANCHCTTHQSPKQLTFSKLPPVFVVQLKRFKRQSATSTSFVKLDAIVDYPLTGLDLQAYMHAAAPSQSSVYDLVAVVHHLGDSIHSGHYTAHCRHPVDGRWTYYDDRQVARVRDAAHVLANTAYILFYIRRDTLDKQWVQRIHAHIVREPRRDVNGEQHDRRPTSRTPLVEDRRPTAPTSRTPLPPDDRRPSPRSGLVVRLPPPAVPSRHLKPVVVQRPDSITSQSHMQTDL